MLITHTATFNGRRPETFGVRSRSLLRPAKPAERCSICQERSWQWHPARRVVMFRGRGHVICGPCNKRYQNATGQMARYGLRFRFVERAEIPRSGVAAEIPLSVQKEVFKFLLLAKGRQEIRGKEVMWMPEDMTQRVLRLPKRVAAAMKNTYAVRGDDATESDDVALQKIKDLIEEIDPNVFKDLLRSRKKK